LVYGKIPFGNRANLLAINATTTFMFLKAPAEYEKKGNSSYFENSPSFQISWTCSDFFRMNENFIKQLSAMFTCRDGKDGEVSNQALEG